MALILKKYCILKNEGKLLFNLTLNMILRNKNWLVSLGIAFARDSSIIKAKRRNCRQGLLLQAGGQERGVHSAKLRRKARKKKVVVNKNVQGVNK